MGKYQVPYDIDEWKSKVTSAVRDTSKMKYKKQWFWSNDSLYPGYKHVPSGSKTRHYLKNAKGNNTIERIHNFDEPLAFGVKLKGGGGPFHTHWIDFQFYDLDRIKLLSKNEDTKMIKNNRTYEYWHWFCDSDHSKPSKFRSWVHDKLAKHEA